MSKTNMTMMLALMLLANGVMAAKMQGNEEGLMRRASSTSSLATNADEDMKEAIVADADYIATFMATGCPNISPWLGWWKLQTETHVLNDMFTYCTLTKSGSASASQVSNCCGTSDCTPTACVQQSSLQEAPVTGRCFGNSVTSENVDCSGGDGTNTSNTHNKGITSTGTTIAQCCQAANVCSIQHCIKCESTAHECEECDAQTTLSITGDCLEACPPGQYELQQALDPPVDRTCSLCNGDARRRRANSCTHCPDGHISQADDGLDNCTNIQTTCSLDQCTACANCFANAQEDLQQCLQAKSSDSDCINFNEVWCGTFMQNMNECEGFSLGCYHLLMCQSPCVCDDWKQVRCGGDYVPAGDCPATLLEEFTRSLTKATQETGTGETGFVSGSTPSGPRGNSSFVVSASSMTQLLDGGDTEGAGAAEHPQKNSAKVSLMGRQNSQASQMAAEGSLDEALADKCSSAAR